MPKSHSFTVDAVGDDEPVIAQSPCFRITIFEDAQAGTANYTVRKPDPGSTAITIPAGAKHVFERLHGSAFSKGQIVGYVAAASGSFTMAQVED
jgi:hypothetical protein